MSEQNKLLVRRAVEEVWNRGKFPLVDELAASDLVVPSAGQACQEQTRDAWDKIASGYGKTNTPTQMWLGYEGLRRAELRTGMRFLDVAAGSGALSLPAACLGAQVLATDQSPVMLEL